MDESALPAPTHEPTDVSPSTIWIGVLALIVTVVALALLVLWLFPGRTVDRTIRLPLPRYPSPELQTNPREGLAKFRAAKLQQLNSTGWIDRAHGIAHIPITDAMREVATEGIADWPAPTAPAPAAQPPTAPAPTASNLAPPAPAANARTAPVETVPGTPASQTDSATSGDRP